MENGGWRCQASKLDYGIHEPNENRELVTFAASPIVSWLIVPSE